MGEYAYMALRCRKDDAHRFEPTFSLEMVLNRATHPHAGTSLLLDAAADAAQIPVVVNMVDEAHRNADTDDLPRDVPYFGYFCGVPGCWNAGVFACDGTRFAEAHSLEDGSHSPAVEQHRDGPDADDQAAAQLYWEVRKAAEAAMQYEEA